MGAGLASSTISGVNVNQVQFGDKLQGLAPQATHFFIAGNGRAGWNQYRTRTNGNKRDFVFCMNQLGGVGAAKSQFKIRGLNKPDGARKCAPRRYISRRDIERLRWFLQTRIRELQEVQSYFANLLPDWDLCLVGSYESVFADLMGCECAQNESLHTPYPFVHLTGQAPSAEELSHLSPGVMGLLQTASQDQALRNRIMTFNTLFRFVTGKGCTGAELGAHTLGLVQKSLVPELRDCGYGNTTVGAGLNIRIYNTTSYLDAYKVCTGTGGTGITQAIKKSGNMSQVLSAWFKCCAACSDHCAADGSNCTKHDADKCGSIIAAIAFGGAAIVAAGGPEACAGAEVYADILALDGSLAAGWTEGITTEMASIMGESQAGLGYATGAFGF